MPIVKWLSVLAALAIASPAALAGAAREEPQAFVLDSTLTPATTCGSSPLGEPLPSVGVACSALHGSDRFASIRLVDASGRPRDGAFESRGPYRPLVEGASTRTSDSLATGPVSSGASGEVEVPAGAEMLYVRVPGPNAPAPCGSPARLLPASGKVTVTFAGECDIDDSRW